MTDAPEAPEGRDGPVEEYYPEFRTVRRGYDPDEVEQVLDDLYTSLNDAVREAEEHARGRVAAERHQHALESTLADAQRRIAELESRPGGDAQAFEGVGARVNEILRAATTEASEIVRQAHEQAEALAGQAEAASVSKRAEAERLTAELAERRTQADAEIERLRQDARAEAATVRAEAMEYRARVRGQLAQVRERLISAMNAEAASVPGPEASRAGPDPEPPADVDTSSPQQHGGASVENGVRR